MSKIQKIPSPNQSESQQKKTLIVLHSTLGSFTSAVGWLTNPKSKASANIVIGRKGEIAELVDITKAAWHAGNIYNPSERAKRVLKKDKSGKYINPNLYTIGIEFAAGFDNDKDGTVEQEERLWSQKQMQAAIWCLKELEKNKNADIVLDPKFIITHRDIASYKPDMEAWRDEILKQLKGVRESNLSRKNNNTIFSNPLNHNQENMITYKKQNEPAVYIAVGTKLIPFATDWQTYQSDFKDAVIVELSPKEFEKFTIAQNVQIKPRA